MKSTKSTQAKASPANKGTMKGVNGSSAKPGSNKGKKRSTSSFPGLAVAAAAVAVAALAMTPQGNRVLQRAADYPRQLLTNLTGRQQQLMNNDEGASDAAQRNASVTVTIFMNGDDTDGKRAVLTASEHGALDDIGRAISGLHGCKNVVDLGGDDDPGYCKVHNSVGVRVRRFSEVRNDDRLFLVPHDRLFVFATVKVGYSITLPHVENPEGKKVVMETLATSPRVFELRNFMTPDEADVIIADALAIEDEAHKLKRSSTGVKGGAVSKTRTSENAFLTTSDAAMALKHRIFRLLGIEHYRETWADGLQVLRYNVSKAYIAHLDYLEADPKSVHDFDSGGSGINRFATVLLYFTEPGEGGETVFTHAPPLAEGGGAGELRPMDKTLLELRAKEGEYLESIGITRNSWEEKLIAQCRSRLAFKPKKGAAVLFYSQHPDGAVDNASEHGACPVIRGQKWAANLWVWNGPRYGYTKRDPRTGKMIESGLGDNYKVLATFFNDDLDGAVLYYQDQLWAALDVGASTAANSYVGHEWNVRVDGEVVQEFSITEYVPEQTFTIRRDPPPAASSTAVV